MIDEKRAMTIARKVFGLTLTSMPDSLYVLIDEAVKDANEECAKRAEAYAYMSENFNDLAHELRTMK